MSENCMANCMASKIHLYLRNKIFYYRVELPRVNHKRRYQIISLHTQNYFEAREKIKQMVTIEEKFTRLRQLYNNLIFEEDTDSFNPFGSYGLGSTFSSSKLSKRNRTEDVTELLTLYHEINSKLDKLVKISEEYETLLNKIKNIEGTIEEFIGPVNTLLAESKSIGKKNLIALQTPKCTIGQVLDNLLLQKSASTKNRYQTRIKQTIVNLLKSVGLSLDDDYAKFHNVSMIQKLSENIVRNSSTKNDRKKAYVNYLKELARVGNNINPDAYKTNILNLFPKISGTRKIDKNPHKPYEKDKLLEMFDPKHDYFKKNPDAFWACMIALFTGARINAAITLQYKDILNQNGIPCIQFLSDHHIKQLKNDASERLVPIHQQLLNLGFVDYINRQKTKLKAKDEDFIIKKCKTKSGEYNNKFFMRELAPFFMEIRVKTGANDGYDFHSFRKNISIALQDSGVGRTYINDIIGWEGDTTMEQSYSNHSLEQIKEEMKKLNYDFLEPHFKKWKTIMAKL